jgi:hypothetical protein
MFQILYPLLKYQKNIKLKLGSYKYMIRCFEILSLIIYHNFNVTKTYRGTNFYQRLKMIDKRD